MTAVQSLHVQRQCGTGDQLLGGKSRGRPSCPDFGCRWLRSFITITWKHCLIWASTALMFSPIQNNVWGMMLTGRALRLLMFGEIIGEKLATVIQRRSCPYHIFGYWFSLISHLLHICARFRPSRAVCCSNPSYSLNCHHIILCYMLLLSCSGPQCSCAHDCFYLCTTGHFTHICSMLPS